MKLISLASARRRRLRHHGRRPSQAAQDKARALAAEQGVKGGAARRPEPGPVLATVRPTLAPV